MKGSAYPEVQTTFSSDLPDVDLVVRRNIARMLSRSSPDEESTRDMIMKQYVGPLELIIV